MKYHLNKTTGKVGPCEATVKKCPHGGASGQENHFNTLPEANTASEVFMKARYPEGKHTKDTPFRAFSEAVAVSLVKAGVVASASELPTVKTEASMVSKWFAGDRSKFEVFKQAHRDELALNPATKRALKAMLHAGLDVKLSKPNSPTYDAPSSDYSNVELLEDGPSTLDLESLRSGTLKAF